MTNAISRLSSYLMIGGMTVAAGWGVLTVSKVLDDLNNPLKGNNPVAVQASSPVQREGGVAAMPTLNAPRLRGSNSSAAAAAPAMAGDQPSTALPSATMSSTGLFNHGGAVATRSTGARQTASSSTADNTMRVRSNAESARKRGLSFGGNMLAMSSATFITAPGATRTRDVGATDGGTSAPSGPRRVGRDDNIGEVGETDLPIGNAFWPLALLALAYAAVRKRKLIVNSEK